MKDEMKRQIPEPLQNPEFRFYLVAKDKKIPIEPKFNTENCYGFFQPKLLNHLLRGGNAGVICGYGNLIVIDFDDLDYQNEKAPLLPKTFTCRSARKGLKHFYYILKGDMISKIGIGVDKRLCDIMGNKSPINCPPSSINGKIYFVVDETPIQEIDYETLSKIFGIGLQKRHLNTEINYEPQPLKVQETIDTLKRLGVLRAKANRFHCPFHESNGSGNLCIFPSGKIKCFHCDFSFASAKSFENYFNKRKKEFKFEGMGEIYV